MYVTHQRRNRDILDAVCEHYEIRMGDLRSGLRNKRHATARAVACYLLRDMGLSYPDIGRAIGKHHTTVIAAVERTEKALDTVEGFRADVEAVKNKAAHRAAQSVSGGAQ